MVQQSPDDSRSGAAEGRGRGSAAGDRLARRGGAARHLHDPEHRPHQADFLFWSFTWPLWLFTVVTALVGALIWFGSV